MNGGGAFHEIDRALENCLAYPKPVVHRRLQLFIAVGCNHGTTPALVFKNGPSSMPKKRIVWFGMKLSPEQKRKIELLARECGLSQKEAVMTAVDAALNDKVDELEVQKESFLDAYEKYCGAVEGPGDLNVNRTQYMRGYGRSRHN
jgi:hypothetical protein